MWRRGEERVVTKQEGMESKCKGRLPICLELYQAGGISSEVCWNYYVSELSDEGEKVRIIYSIFYCLPVNKVQLVMNQQ